MLSRLAPNSKLGVSWCGVGDHVGVYGWAWGRGKVCVGGRGGGGEGESSFSLNSVNRV